MRALVLIILNLVLCSFAQAYMTIGESGELLAPGTYQVGLEPQFFTNKGGGANIGAFFDAPAFDGSSMRIHIGAGSTVDFYTGASLKYIPFPDIDNQPAMGIRAAGIYARDSEDNILTLQLAPLFSKKVQTEEGLFIPYAAFALDLTNTDSRNYTGTQFMFGTEYKTAEIPDLYFGIELGLNLKDSYSYVSGTVTFPFDSSKGFFE